MEIYAHALPVAIAIFLKGVAKYSLATLFTKAINIE